VDIYKLGVTITNLGQVFQFISSRILELETLIRENTRERDIWLIHTREVGLKPDSSTPGVVSLVSPSMFFYVENRIVATLNKSEEARREIDLLRAYRASLSPCYNCGGKGDILFYFISHRPTLILRNALSVMVQVVHEVQRIRNGYRLDPSQGV